MILALYYLQSYYKMEIMRGIHGMGNYHLHTQFKDLLNEPLFVEDEVYSPAEIVKRIKTNNFKLSYKKRKDHLKTVHLR